MLPICFGEATKFSQFLLESDKSYRVVAKLGVQTTTGDCEGEVIATCPIVNITKDRVEAVMKTFVGEIEQIPPMYSAIKFQGDPLYKLARRGIEVERQPRKIKIFSLTLLTLTEDELSFQVHCSKGTYVRTLVEDITRELGCGGHVIALCREMVTPYQHAPMVTLAAMECLAAQSGFSGLAAYLLPVETAVKNFSAVTLSTAAAFYLRTGQSVRVNVPTSDTRLVRLLSEDGKFLGMGELLPDGRVKPHRLRAV
jgi:tRNA pseudouridine55 synthase